MNKNALCYYNAAKKMLLPVEVNEEIDGFTLFLGRKRYFFIGRGTPNNNYSSVMLAQDKSCMTNVLAKKGFPVPNGVCIDKVTFENNPLENILGNLTFPLVVKPNKGGLGVGVQCNIQTVDELRDYLIANFSLFPQIIIEEFHDNLNSYRVLILNNKILAVVMRIPSKVEGDGIHTIEELIALTNRQREKINDTLGPLSSDFECKKRLELLGLTLDYIPQKNEEIFIGYTSNASRGGTYHALGKKICIANKRLLKAAAHELNLNYVGFDVQCQDIGIPIEKSRGVIIEANASPSIRLHEEALEGPSVRISHKIISRLIYRHPLSYLAILIRNTKTALYIRSSAILLLGLIGYKLYS